MHRVLIVACRIFIASRGIFCCGARAPELAGSVVALWHSVQLLSHVWLFVTPWTAARQASLSITNSCSLLKLMSIESMMPSNHLILYHPFFLLPSVFPSISVFSNESVLRNRWPKYWSFSFSISPSNEYLGLISFKLCGIRDLNFLPGVKHMSFALQDGFLTTGSPGKSWGIQSFN